MVARQRKQRNPTHTYARRAKKELNRGRWEVRETKVFRVQDAVEVGFPGTRTIIRTYREVWQTRKTGKKDKNGKDVRKCVGKPKKTTAQARSDLKLHPAKLVRIMMKGGLQ